MYNPIGWLVYDFLCVCACIFGSHTCNALPLSVRVIHVEQAERVTCYIGHVTRSHPCVKIMEARCLSDFVSW